MAEAHVLHQVVTLDNVLEISPNLLSIRIEAGPFRVPRPGELEAGSVPEFHK